MIRIYKSSEGPSSLEHKTSWNCEDVNSRLMKDQHGKCYLCERRIVTDFQVEHLKSCNANPDKAYQWSNLLWACSYCNQKKSDSFDCILNPIECDVENSIFQKIDFPKSFVIFRSEGDPTIESEATVELLKRIFNGLGKYRKLREQQLYDYTKARITSFQALCLSWLNNESEELRNAIIEELDIRSEFLGFKYWIIRSNYRLLSTFSSFIIWNKSK